MTLQTRADSVRLDRGRGTAAAAITSRVLPGTEIMLNEIAPDTAIVGVSGSGELRAGSDYFDATASLSASVRQGQSWYPLYRAANGYAVDVSVSGASGATPAGRVTRCLVGSIWGTSDPCTQSLDGHNGYSSTTGTTVGVGSSCSYIGRLETTGVIGWYQNFDRLEGNRNPREATVHDYRSSEIRRRCLPDVAELCDDPSYCSGSESGGDASGGPSASVEGEVEWQVPLIESSAWTEVVVCYVTDWYIWTSSGWAYLDTTIDQCWVERR